MRTVRDALRRRARLALPCTRRGVHTARRAPPPLPVLRTPRLRRLLARATLASLRVRRERTTARLPRLCRSAAPAAARALGDDREPPAEQRHRRRLGALQRAALPQHPLHLLAQRRHTTSRVHTA